MNTNKALTRRNVLAGTAASASLALAGCSHRAHGHKPRIQYDNAFFYDADGKFKPEAAKEACIALMNYHGYPVYPQMRDELWVSDYGAGRFAEVGVGALFFVNNTEHRYMMLDIYLLPNQMLPEHYHVATAENPAKLEGWVTRHGLSYVYGAGEPTPNIKAVIPQCHLNGTATVMHETILAPGQFTCIKQPEERHWQFGGPEGAIVTEVATVHDGNGIRHTDEKLVFG